MKMWTLFDHVTSATYTFTTNPNKMDSPINTKQLQSLPHYWSPRTWKTPTMPSQWSFGGNLYTDTEYNSLLDWMTRKHELQVNDHLSRVFSFLPRQIEFTDVRSRKYPWKHTYTVSGFLTVQYGMSHPGGLG
jgi:hypothetical protein